MLKSDVLASNCAFNFNLRRYPTARAKHLPRLLLDAPALPKAIVRLLRALCQLPLPPLPSGSGGGGDDGSGDCFGFAAGPYTRPPFGSS